MAPSLLLRTTLCALASGCYLSHAPSGDDSSDAAVTDVRGVDVPGVDVPMFDVPPVDAPFDAGTDVIDAGPVECQGVRLDAELRLTLGPDSVSPRLVALPRGEVGVVSVSSNGSPTRLHYQRVDANLGDVGGSQVLTDRSFSWGQPTRVGDALYVAHAIDSAGTSGRSSIRAYGLEGSPAGRPVDIEASHPNFISPADSGLFWFSFRNGPQNTLQVAHVGANGDLLHEVREIDMGRYGSGSRAVQVPGGGAHILAYTREASPGVRDGFVNVLRSDGGLGPERRLSSDGDVTVAPVVIGGELVLVRHNDEALIIEPTDIETLERRDRVRFPPVSGRPLVAQLAGRLLVIHFQGATMYVDDFGREIDTPTRLTINVPDAVTGAVNLVESPASARTGPGVVIGDQSRRDSVPWLVRLGCTNDVDG